MNSSHLIIGQLHGGSGTCAPLTDYYGRFDISWNGDGSTPQRRLKDWLDPNGTNAMSLVGQSTSPSYSISGPTSFCTSATYTINAPAGATVTWSYAIAAGSSTVSLTPSGNNVTVTASGSAKITLTATVSNECSNINVSQNIFAGAPVSSLLTVTGDLNIMLQGPGQPAYYGFTYNGTQCNSTAQYGITNAQYQIVGNYNSAQIGSGMACAVTGLGESVVWGSSGTRSISVKVQNSCGWSGWSPTQFVSVSMHSSLYAVSPNPATNVVNIQPNTTAASTISTANTAQGSIVSNTNIVNTGNVSAPNITQVNIYNNMGKLVLTRKFSGSSNKAQINISSLSLGIYYIDIITANYKEKQTLQIK